MTLPAQNKRERWTLVANDRTHEPFDLIRSSEQAQTMGAAGWELIDVVPRDLLLLARNELHRACLGLGSTDGFGATFAKLNEALRDD